MTIQDELYTLLSNPMDLPPVFWEYMIQKWLADAPVFPVSQVFGFSQYTAQLGTSSGLHFNNNTANSGAGPQLTGLPTGNYVVLAGFDVNGVNSPTLTLSPGGMVVSVFPRGALLALSGTSITSTLAGTGGGAGGDITNPWLLALRYSNL